MLIIFSGLPGAGKTTLARQLAGSLQAVYLRIDTIERALAAGDPDRPVGDAGYRIAYAVAEDNLRAGRTVVADSVNPLEITRNAWRSVAERAGVGAVDIEVVCSDQVEHRRRVETRSTEIPVTWHEVVTRHYEPWSRDHIRIDTAGEQIEQSFARLQEKMRATSR